MHEVPLRCISSICFIFHYFSREEAVLGMCCEEEGTIKTYELSFLRLIFRTKRPQVCSASYILFILINFKIRSSGRQCEKSLFCELCKKERLRPLSP